MTYELHLGSCLDILPTIESDSVDAIVTDPPYELGFMGKSWDSTGIAFNVDVWRECLRVLKSGGHLVAFSGSRTYHRMAVAIEDAGFEIRDQLMWLYGSGFPKSHNIAKAIDKLSGHVGEVIGTELVDVGIQGGSMHAGREREIREREIREHSPQAQQWKGWGTALKPAHEPLVLARKPFKGSATLNVLEFGTGALNIDGARVGSDELGGGTMQDFRDVGAMSKETIGIDKLSFGQNPRPAKRLEQPTYTGRFPANVMHDGSEAVTDVLGDAARFFYCAKASRSDRDQGLELSDGREIAAKGNGLARSCATCGASTLEGCDCPDRTFVNPTRKNFHPTVKPTDLMRYLCRLVTPPNGKVLDPFTGSGSTGKAAMLERFDFVGIELDPNYVQLAASRIEAAQEQAGASLF